MAVAELVAMGIWRVEPAKTCPPIRLIGISPYGLVTEGYAIVKLLA
jgi:hypothetical protein